MAINSRPLANFLLAGAAVAAVSAFPTAASAAPTIISAGSDYATTPFTFSFGDSSFTFSGTGDPFGPTAVSGTGDFNTIFGSPTSYFVDRGTVTFGADNQYAAFAGATPIRFSNGDNFIGLRATRGDDVFYGYAFTTNSVLNSYAFESVAGRAITATTDAAAGAVPEPASWAMMLGGFGAIGGAMRSRRKTAVSFG